MTVQVVSINLEEDGALCALQQRAAEATARVAAQGTGARVEALARLVVEAMGGSFDDNETLEHFWQSESGREKRREE